MSLTYAALFFFLGHGSPMNVLEDNLYTRSWQSWG